MKSLSIGKRLAVAAVAAAALAGPVTAAHALQFNQGDAVLAVYGNTTEYVANLGSFSNLIATGVNHDLSGFLGTIGPTSSLKYTIVGYQGTGIYFGDRDPVSSFTAQQKNQVLPNTLISALENWRGPLASTGNASRSVGENPSVGPTNFYLAPGTKTAQDIIKTVKQGLYVTDLIGFGINMVTGDYSRGAAGFWIEGGELTYPVEEITIAGNLKDMFAGIEMIGSDLVFRGRIASPTVKIAEMMVAGN